VGVVKGAGPFPRKIIFFCPQNNNFGRILPQFLTGKRHGQSLEALGHGVYGSIAKRSLQNQYLSKNSGQTTGRSHHRLHEYVTGVKRRCV